MRRRGEQPFNIPGVSDKELRRNREQVQKTVEERQAAIAAELAEKRRQKDFNDSATWGNSDKGDLRRASMGKK